MSSLVIVIVVYARRRPTRVRCGHSMTPCSASPGRRLLVWLGLTTAVRGQHDFGQTASQTAL
jgi:hypothetical protein